MLTARGQAKVMDFGLAKVGRDKASVASEAETESLLTEPGKLIGTVPYMSPEPVKGEVLDARSDIFSFGAVLYEMATEHHPFAVQSMTGTISAILTQEPPPLTRYSNVPAELQRIVRKCLEKDRERRYSSAHDLLVDLRNFKRDTDSDVVASSVVSQRATTRKWIYGAVALAILALGAIGLYFLRRQDQSTSNQIHSLAILPFVNASADPNAEYLGDGITESLINSFSQLPQLKVIAGTTAFRYKGKDTDAQTVGRDLRVDAIITGRVIQHGDTLIVQADLLNTADGSQVWGERYSRRLSDIFAVQEQIAKEISGKLLVRLTGEKAQGFYEHYTENIRAYQNYLQGRSAARRRTPEDLFTAISYYGKAIEEDSNYALAYAGLADAYMALTTRLYIAPDEGQRKAEEAATKALSLNENLAEAHAAVGQIDIVFARKDFPAGDRELRRAIELIPSLAAPHHFLAVSLLEQGRLDEGVNESLKARELDPLAPIIARQVAYNCVLKRDYQRALELLRQSNELGPPFSLGSEIEIYIQNRLLNEALDELEKAQRDRKDEPLLIASTGMVYAAQGRRAEALQIIQKLEQMSPTPTQWIAKIYATLNEKELALRWLERGVESGAIFVFFKDAPIWDPIRSDPRFAELLRRMNMPG
jgi:eukaryotic-like serine/threonine-protein kinase